MLFSSFLTGLSYIAQVPEPLHSSKWPGPCSLPAPAPAVLGLQTVVPIPCISYQLEVLTQDEVGSPLI